MKIASWNVNSIKARGEHVKNWLDSAKPDILMVQELKGLEFPAEEFEALGHYTEAVTQKAYNGVAIFARKETFKDAPEVVHTHLPYYTQDEQARYLEFRVQDKHGKPMTFINIYLPNGNPVDTEKYDYKLEWMDHLIARLRKLRANEEAFAIGGDFNVIPEDRDCYDPKAWADDALFKLPTRQKFRAMLNLGLTDAFRVYNQDDKQYTFWDYQGGAWPKDKGIRIDHFLLSPPMADRLQNCYIDRDPRALDKPSDHTPIIIELAT